MELTLSHNDRPIYIARSSHGKDSLKMLDVIISRGLPLDRITTTDIWATDTIRGEHPLMVRHKAFVDEYIWRKYRIEVEHLCAMRNGEKVTYEKLFYHIPKRRNAADCSRIVQVEREREREPAAYSASRLCGGHGVNQTSNATPKPRPQGFPAQIGSWCKKLKIDYIRIPCQHPPHRSMVPEAQNPVFGWPRHEGQEKYRGVHRHSSRRAQALWSAQ